MEDLYGANKQPSSRTTNLSSTSKKTYRLQLRLPQAHGSSFPLVRRASRELPFRSSSHIYNYYKLHTRIGQPAIGSKSLVDSV